MALKREKHPMPADVKRALASARLTGVYGQRPAYQQNDYIGWISRAKLPATRQKRLDQMIEELKDGNRYMKMRWQPKK